MNFKIDYPFPPKHYKTTNFANCQIAPNIEEFIKNNETIHIFGQPENIKSSEIRIHPNYLINCKSLFLKNKTLKEELLNLIKKLKKSFRNYLEALNKNSENLYLVQKKIYEICLQIFYVLKIGFNTTVSSLKLKKVLEREIEENKKIIFSHKKNFEDLKKDLEG